MPHLLQRHKRRYRRNINDAPILPLNHVPPKHPASPQRPIQIVSRMPFHSSSGTCSVGVRFVRPAQFTKISTLPNSASTAGKQFLNARLIRHVRKSARVIVYQAPLLRPRPSAPGPPPPGRHNISPRQRQPLIQRQPNPTRPPNNHCRLPTQIQLRMRHKPHPSGTGFSLCPTTSPTTIRLSCD